MQPAPLRRGRSWKQLYFERNLEAALESYDPTASDPNELKRLLTFSKKYTRRLNVMQLPGRELYWSNPVDP